MSSFTETDPGALLVAILDDVGLSFAVIDEHGKIAFANKKTRTMWGENSVVPGESLARCRSSCRIQDNHGKDIPIEKALIPSALKGKKTRPLDFRVIFPDGNVKWMHRITERFTVFGITGWLVIMADETEQVLLRRAMQQCGQMELLGQLTRGMVHDLNNMFSVIEESLYLARRGEGKPESMRDHLQQIELASRKESAW